jgi:hypothetical protein
VRSGTASLALCAIAAAFAAPATAQQFRPRTEYERLTERPKPVPTVPAELSGIVRGVSPDRLLVRTLGGGEVAVDIEWYEVRSFTLHPGGRFLGLDVGGYEEYGHILVDRAGAGAVHETGVAPTFSPDGRWFAAAELTDFGFNNLEGVAVWEVLVGSSRRRFFSDAMPYGFEWRVEGWPTPSCVAISTSVPEASPAARTHYGIEMDGDGAVMRAAHDRPGCTRETP